MPRFQSFPSVQLGFSTALPGSALGALCRGAQQHGAAAAARLQHFGGGAAGPWECRGQCRLRCSSGAGGRLAPVVVAGSQCFRGHPGCNGRVDGAGARGVIFSAGSDDGSGLLGPAVVWCCWAFQWCGGRCGHGHPRGHAGSHVGGDKQGCARQW